MSSIKILTLNIHKGFSAGSKKLVLSEIRQEILECKPDLVFLQEVIGRHDRHAEKHLNWPKTSQHEFIGAEDLPHHAYGMNATYEQGHHGNALLSRFPILSSSNSDLSAHPFEERGMLSAHILVPEQALNIHCACLHLGLFGAGRARQLARVGELLQHKGEEGTPLILAGDFNDWALKASGILEKQAGVKEVFKEWSGKHAKTFPRHFPLLSLDRIYYRGLKIKDAQVLRNQHSDHVALYAEFELDKPALKS